MGNELTPERIWLDRYGQRLYDDHPQKLGGVEYVRADLLATKVKEEREATFKLTPDEVEDLRETLVNAADDLDTEGLGDTDSCIFARRWAERLKEK